MRDELILIASTLIACFYALSAPMKREQIAGLELLMLD